MCPNFLESPAFIRSLPAVPKTSAELLRKVMPGLSIRWLISSRQMRLRKWVEERASQRDARFRDTSIITPPSSH